ncbi:cyclophilin-like fold protein [Aeromonas media]|uniref:cyclophilin-like fold protein n=1 Tax=Aeromonas media TaxID=651 RepID=UPI00209C3AB2|nr:cyclophilin-like fold protein [Aeromonas media]
MTRGILTRAMVLLLVATSAVAATDEVSHSRRETMNIRMTMAGKIITASLEESDSARDFFAMLPLTLPLEDYAETEKIAYLPGKLTTQGAPKGIDPNVGDICYYTPWGNLAIYYRDFGYSSGLIRLGRITSGLDALTAQPSGTLTIEAVK